jgi:hypothetical protein
MKYKGKTVQLQRIKGKKAPRIEEVELQEQAANKAFKAGQVQKYSHP